MTTELERLRRELSTAAPEAGDEARKRAIDAGMAAFDEKFQGSARPARPTRDPARTGAFISRGVHNMLLKFSNRQTLLATASLATIAVAVVITGQISKSPVPVVVPEEVAAVSEKPEPAPVPAPKPVVRQRLEKTARTAAPPATQDPLGEMAEADAVNDGYAIAVMPDVSEGAAAPAGGPTALGRVAETESGLPPALAQETVHRSAGIVGSQPYQQDEPAVMPEANTERFPEVETNPLKITSEEPVSTFSIDVDTASYAYTRSAIMAGRLPVADAVRTEELINYFAYAYPVPETAETPFTTSVSVIETPWNKDTRLLHIGIKGYDLPAEARPPVNLVFLIDTSGSMQDANKLPLLVNSFRLLLGELQPEDRVAIVTYAGSAGIVLEPTPASDSAKILDSLNRLSAGGSTAGQAGLQQAYSVAEAMAGETDATTRVILATDGDFNVGISDPDDLKAYVEKKRESGVYLSVLGFGRGNYNDALMQALAQNGNGQAAYIDTLAEARKVLVEQVGGALFPIAQDVKIQVEFNPAEIAEYRLIGYETRALRREDFNNDRVDAGEIGAGHSVTAIYEITPVGSPAVRVDDLRYGTGSRQPSGNGEYAFVKLRYKRPGEATSNLITTPVRPDADADAGLGSEVRFAAAVAGFGQVLRGDTLMNGWTIADSVALAERNKAADPFGYRAEFVTLARLADSLE
ncbi:MAG: von Willebrand factor type A domain-containing protein [Paracoccaceae bacterium]